MTKAGAKKTIHNKPSLAGLVNLDQPINVVDIGANPIDGDPPYKPLLDAGLAHITGFEPNPEALAKLNAVKSENETYLPNAVFDGTEQELKVCMAEGMTSLLEPNPDLLDFFHGFPEWSAVQERLPLQTVRLDDIPEISNIDFLKIDIQGAELDYPIRFFNAQITRLLPCRR